jgi:hypothetical protein
MKKRVIFTSYDDLDPNERSNEDLAKSKMVEEYFDRLIQNKKDYADLVGADFVFYHNSIKDFDSSKNTNFTSANLHKHQLMSNLAEEYEEILYVDLDVCFNTHLNIFEEHNLDAGIHIKDMDHTIVSKQKNSLLYSNLGLRSPTLKYHIAKDLLDGEDNKVINTGIILGKSEFVKQIRFSERAQEATNKINEIKSIESNLFEQQYYPNNESIFSYILEKYKVPYVIMEEKWHQILDEEAKTIDGYCLHFINKQFNAFYKTKTQCIFSIYIEIPDDQLDNPKNYKGLNISKSLMVKNQLAQYKDKLLENHKEYAKNIGAKYINFGYDENYKQFRSRFPILSEYDVINLYKIYLLDELTKEYDHVLYIDFDVLFKQQHSIFDFFALDYMVCCKYNSRDALVDNDGLPIPTKNLYSYFEHHYKHDFRHPQTKYWNTHAMLLESGLTGKNSVFNTGVVCASRYAMDKLDYFSDIEEIIAMMKELKEDEHSIYHKNVRSQFGYDNETIFSYKIKKNNVPCKYLTDTWHYISDLSDGRALKAGTPERNLAKTKYVNDCSSNNTVIVHFISKNFGLEFDI